ncbi:MAG TPA: sensor histidine kinase [Pyrinomonadaceae bacterium]|nr:sensor histidine kinase [Pyrinomonadaceae bacterium]
MNKRVSLTASLVGLAIFLLLHTSAIAQQDIARPTIEFISVPLADKGGQETTGKISGRVVGAQPGQKVVLFARSGSWFIQPFIDSPFTDVLPDSSWSNTTHLGTEYAALLVREGFQPPAVIESIPSAGGNIVAVAIVPGRPRFWQTLWFWTLIFLTLAGIGLFFYQRRQQRLISEMNLRFEHRLAERTRIAQDLHDTLLQGLLSASMQLHVADTLLEKESAAKPLVSRVLELMGQVVEEGRNAVQGLRTPTATLDLDQAFLQIHEEPSLEKPVDYKVVVEGTPKPLHPVIRDEVYRIGREAIVNAFLHSKASKIEVILEYNPKFVQLVVRDDGVGIDPSVINEGIEGHWGLSGMRERANSIGAKLSVMSRADLGTEVELYIPGAIAFENNEVKRSTFDLRRLFQRS